MLKKFALRNLWWSQSEPFSHELASIIQSLPLLFVGISQKAGNKSCTHSSTCSINKLYKEKICQGISGLAIVAVCY